MLLAAAFRFGSNADAVLEVNDPTPEVALIQELKRRADVLRQCGLAATTTIGVRNRWYSSTSPALIVCPASWAPPIVMSGPELSLSRRIGAMSKSCSICVRTRGGSPAAHPGVFRDGCFSLYTFEVG